MREFPFLPASWPEEKLADFFSGFFIASIAELSLLWMLQVLGTAVKEMTLNPSNFLTHPLNNRLLHFTVIPAIPTILNILVIIFIHSKKQYLSLGMVAGSALYFLVVKLFFLFG